MNILRWFIDEPMGSKNEGLPNPPLEHVYTDSPWQQRVDLDLERQHLAAKCQSFSSLISPWAISGGQSDLDSPSPNQIHAFRSPPPLKSPVWFSVLVSFKIVPMCDVVSFTIFNRARWHQEVLLILVLKTTKILHFWKNFKWPQNSSRWDFWFEEIRL